MNAHPFPTAHCPASIVETLVAWRERTPERIALTLLREGEQVESTLTYRELHDQAMQFAAALRARWPRGTRVLLMLPTGVEFVCAFYGCLMGGMVAIPANHPQQPRKVAQWKKLQAIVRSSDAKLIVAPEKSMEVLAAMRASDGLFADCDIETWSSLAWSSLTPADASAQPPVSCLPAAGDLAFLQYTSGSTGSPKGVMLTHANILNNQAVIASLMGHHAETRVVSWLPLYHDMGLSAILQMASIGCSMVLMSPVAFIQKPLRWLRAISHHGAHTSGGPNFAYRLAAAALRSEQAAEARLDLSSWELAFCGAEPISPATAAEFVQAAQPYGFAPGAFHACYGMAEATVQVTGAAKGAGMRCLDVSNSRLAQGIVQPAQPGDADLKSLVSCGAAAMGNEIRIVAADGAPVAGPHHVGEIWVRGPSVGLGYYGDAQATQASFGATLRGDAGGPFLRTGDLGAIVGGELYVTGRLKDLLIVRGRNFYPQDIEDCVQQAAPELRSGFGAALSVTVDGEEKLVVVQEIGRTQRRTVDTADVFRRMIAAIGDDFGLMPHQIVLVEPATIEKTSSGKIARALCRRAYLQGELHAVATWTEGLQEPAPADAPAAPTAGGDAALAAASRRDIELSVARVAAEFLKLDASRISRTTPWSELGFDSMSAVQLALKVEQATGVRLDPAVLWDCANIEELAAHLAAQRGGVDATARRNAPAAVPVAAVEHALPRSEVELMALTDAQAEALLMKELAR